jgi:hypothetical protein
MNTISLKIRRQRLVVDGRGRNVWEVVETRRELEGREVAVVLCDVWDNHTSRGARERLEVMIPRMNEVTRAVREKGGIVVHAPSDVIDFYREHPARRRVVELPKVEVPVDLEHEDPVLPVDASDGGSDTNEVFDRKNFVYPWTREHPGIEIDEGRDFISADGREHYGLFRSRGISLVVMMGVHTNMCILHRTFGIKQMVRWGVEMALVRDLTDAMYNPAKAPYVGHEEGTGLVVGFIEKFWCGTVGSGELVGT